MFSINYSSSYAGLLLVLLMIFFGRAFRENWKAKEKNWILKSWIYGLISAASFFGIIFIPFDMG
jgi:hypothetical protein